MRVNVSSPVQLVSVLFNEPKLLKSSILVRPVVTRACFSALQRAEIAEIVMARGTPTPTNIVSVLFNEPKLLKCIGIKVWARWRSMVSVLFNEPKLLKSDIGDWTPYPEIWFQCSSTSRNC